MHIFLVVEAHTNEIDQLISWINSRSYPDIKSAISHRFHAREMRLLNVVLPEEWKEAFLTDMRTCFKQDRRHKKFQDTILNNFLAKKFLKKLEFEPIDFDKYSLIQKPTTGQTKYPSVQGYIYPVGIQKDNKANEDAVKSHPYITKGMEMI